MHVTQGLNILALEDRQFNQRRVECLLSALAANKQLRLGADRYLHREFSWVALLDPVCLNTASITKSQRPDWEGQSVPSERGPSMGR